MANYVTAKEAVSHIQSGDRVVLAHSVGEPQHLVQAMMDNYAAYRNVEICHMLALGPCPYCAPEMAGHFRHNSLFAGPGSRKAVTEARAEFTPNFFFESPRLFRSGALPVDVAMITVSPPDEKGFCTYGVTVDYTKAATESAKIVIAQVNKWMPRTFGDSLIHMDDIDFAVCYDEPLFYLPPTESSEVEVQIGAHCASLIRDGACLQLGIGAIPNAVLAYLNEKNDLGIHSEMLMDGILPLIEKGNVNNSRKLLHKDVSVVTFLYGSESLYQYANNNPGIEVYPVDYVNNPMVIAKNPDVVSINSAISVDFMGQVCADTVSASRHHSGAGGFVDFIRGASFSEGGISIIAMPSTAAGGTASRITPELEAGRPVTLSRFESHYIVTEYGIADMRGRSLSERARSLIEIAHPSFRDSLKEAYEKKFKRAY